MVKNNPYASKESLERFIDNSDNEDILDNWFSELYEISLNEICDIPYWLEQYSNQDNMFCQYIPGYWELKKYGDILTIDGKDYKYIDSISLPEELEHQADNSELCYEYRGYSFLRILEVIQ